MRQKKSRKARLQSSSHQSPRLPSEKSKHGCRVIIFNFPVIFAVLLILSCASTLRFPGRNFEKRDQDWRSFRNSCCNCGITSFNLSLPLKLLWKTKTGPSYSNPLIFDNLVVLGTLDQKIAFLEPGSGKKLGSFPLSFPLSITPSARDSILYFPGGKDNSNLFALNLKSRKFLWKKTLRDLSASPITEEGALFVGTERGELLRLNRMTGEKLWQYKTEDFIYSSVAISGETLFFGCGDFKIYSLDKNTGMLFWSYRTGGGIYASPCVQEDTVFIGSADFYFYALESSSGRPFWKFRTGGSIHSSAVWKDGTVFFGSNDGYLYALSSRDGELLWKFKTDGPVHSSPLVVGDKVFFGSLDGYFYGISISNGVQVFKYKTGGMIYASPSFSDGRIFIPSTDGYLYCFG